MLTLQLSPALEEEIRLRAAQKGMTPTKLASEILAESIAAQSSTIPPAEAELIRQILASALDSKARRRQIFLFNKMRDERILPAEYEELLHLNQESSEKDVIRLKCLVSLSELRGVPLPKVMRQLGLQRSKPV